MMHELRAFVVKKRQSPRTHKKLMGLFALTSIAAIIIAESLKTAQAESTQHAMRHEGASSVSSAAMMDHANSIEVSLSNDIETDVVELLSTNSDTQNTEVPVSEASVDVDMQAADASLVNAIPEAAAEAVTADLTNQQTLTEESAAAESFAKPVASSAPSSASDAAGAEEAGGVSPWVFVGGAALAGGGLALAGGGGGSGGGTTSASGAAPAMMEEDDDENDLQDPETDPPPETPVPPTTPDVDMQQTICDAIVAAHEAEVPLIDLVNDVFNGIFYGNSNLAEMESILQSDYGLDATTAAEITQVSEYFVVGYFELVANYSAELVSENGQDWDDEIFDVDAAIAGYEDSTGIDVTPEHEALFENLRFFIDKEAEIYEGFYPVDFARYVEDDQSDDIEYEGVLVISEIMANTQDLDGDPDGNPDANLQWIEIYNPNDVKLSLSNLHVRETSSGEPASNAYWIVQGGDIAIEPNGYLVLSTNLDLASLLDKPVALLVQDPDHPEPGTVFNLNPSTGAVTLLADNELTVIDSVDYDFSEVSGVGAGQSYALDPEVIAGYANDGPGLALENDNNSNWQLSENNHPTNDPEITVIGTPSEANDYMDFS